MDKAILIAGAGPAGISAWLHLHKLAPDLAEQTLVIDKAIFPRDKLCGGVLFPWSLHILNSLEFNLEAPSLIVNNLEYQFGKEVYRYFEPEGFKIIQRLEFDHQFVETAVKRGMQLHQNERIIRIERKHDKLWVMTDKKNYRIQTLIGADGALSKVRRLMLPKHSPHLAPAIVLFNEAHPQFDSEFDQKKMVIDMSYLTAGLQGYVWHFPCIKDDRPFIAHGIGGFGINQQPPRPNIESIFLRELQMRNINPDPKFWHTASVPFLESIANLSKPNILLIGDAAGIEPAFGGGIHMALSYGEVAAHSIIDAFRKRDFSYSDYPHRLQSHSMGAYFLRCTHIAKELYARNKNPLKTIRKFYEKEDTHVNLLLMLLRHPRTN